MEEVKKTKKKNKVASLLLALALILTCGVAGTIAQYQKSLGGTATAQVAKFKVEATQLGEPQNTNPVSLFDNIYDTYGTSITEEHVTGPKIAPGTQGYTDIDITNESDVAVELNLTASLGNTGKVASGGTVNAGTHAGEYIPLQFAVVLSDTALPSQATGDLDSSVFNGLAWTTGDETKDPTGDTQTVNLKDTITNAVKAYNSNKPYLKTNTSSTPTHLRIYWRWAFTSATDSDRDELDTIIGNAIAENDTTTFKAPVITFTARFTQVD